jgi:hypothetical protein
VDHAIQGVCHRDFKRAAAAMEGRGKKVCLNTAAVNVSGSHQRESVKSRVERDASDNFSKFLNWQNKVLRRHPDYLA